MQHPDDVHRHPGEGALLGAGGMGQVFLAVDNILDEGYSKFGSAVNDRGYPQPGLSFTGGVDIEKFLRLRGLTKKYGELLKRFKDGDLNVEFKLISNDSHYVHEKSVDVEFNFDMYSDKLSFDKYYNMAYELTEDIDKVRLQLCKQFEEDGYKHVEYEQSDEQITESILANEYEYLADGTQI